MGITINGFETRFQKPKFGGENPFKSAKPFDDIVDYNSLEDGDLFYIEQKEGWKEVNFGRILYALCRRMQHNHFLNI